MVASLAPLTPSTAMDRPFGVGQFHMPERMVHRLFEIIGAACALVALSPLLMATAVLVKATSRGPVIYRQQRVGRNGELFEILKIRSMVVDNDDSAHRAYATMLLTRDADAIEDENDDGVYKLDDPRVTRVGAIIRRYSIDELPQLWNVLNGDMSLVGPRPMLDWEVALLTDQQIRRLDVKPGCTGLWQVSGRSLLTTQQMLDLDLTYVERCSLRENLRILALTPGALLRGDGAR